MKAHVIFQNISPELARSIVTGVHGKKKESYDIALAALAENQRMRPVFMAKRPLKDQVEWMAKWLRVKANDELAEHFLQIWLVHDQGEMVQAFLAHMGIDHNGDGTIDDLPERLDEDKLKTAVDFLLEAGHSALYIALYFYAFQLLKPEGWSELQDILDTDSRLALHGDVVLAEAA